jgi:hypothetical protein
MATKQFKTWCRIIDYLSDKDPELVTLLRGTCADMTLGSTKGKPGITFLWPQDKKVRDEIAKLAYSMETSEASKACDMFNAMILRDVFKSAADFRRPVVPNSLYPAQQLTVKVDGSTVTFMDGAGKQVGQATLDKEFRDSSKKQNLAVWKLTGEIPITTDKPAKIERFAKRKTDKGGRGAKLGGYNPSNEETQRLRFKIALDIENTYAADMQRWGRSYVMQNYAASLLNFLKKEDLAAAQSAVRLLGRTPLDLYILLESHGKLGTDYIVDDGRVETWWKECAKGQNMCPDINALYDELIVGNEALVKAAAEARKQVQSVGLNVRTSHAKCLEAYKNVFAEEAELRMRLDDLRFITCVSFYQLEQPGCFDVGVFNELVNLIGDVLHGDVKGNLLNEMVLKYSVDLSSRAEQIQEFINSTMFLHVAMTSKQVGELKGVSSKDALFRERLGKFKNFASAAVADLQVKDGHKK